MKNIRIILFTFLTGIALFSISLGIQGDSMQESRSGMNYIPTPVYSEQEDQEVLKLFEGLRVADVFFGGVADRAGSKPDCAGASGKTT